MVPSQPMEKSATPRVTEILQNMFSTQQNLVFVKQPFSLLVSRWWFLVISKMNSFFHLLFSTGLDRYRHKLHCGNLFMFLQKLFFCQLTCECSFKGNSFWKWSIKAPWSTMHLNASYMQAKKKKPILIWLFYMWMEAQISTPWWTFVRLHLLAI